MFTGLVAALGQVTRWERHAGGARVEIETPLAPYTLGESIAVDGACLTVAGSEGRRFSADLSLETLAVTTLGDLEVGRTVNLERSLRLGDPLGGHLVTGHVDATGVVRRAVPSGEGREVDVSLPEELRAMVAVKGSIAVDGVSLTVNAVHDDSFRVTLVPHTLGHTTFGTLAPGRRVNLEVDLLARYAARWLAVRG